jgi:L-cysteine:1D-myo-inositol 2-amino-2-deoxy-alpha-D-glucopyranoside ligase
LAGVLIYDSVTWAKPVIPPLPGATPAVQIPVPTVGLVPLVPAGQQNFAMYVCGITPYDATHLGHAATYIFFDVVNRVARDSGLQVRFVENITDVDQPLFDRAKATDRNWQDLAREQVALFVSDMNALNVVPPDSFVWASDTVNPVISLIEDLIASGCTYRIGQNLYLDVSRATRIDSAKDLSSGELIELSRQRGGDPETQGKLGPLDPVIWRFGEEEPSWPAPFGQGRPGWHVECVAIANEEIGLPFDLQGGGEDLIFPHHQMCAATVQFWRDEPLAHHYLHTGLIWLGNEKMSKSLGNLVFVSRLLSDGVDPICIRLALLDREWGSDLQWSSDLLVAAEARLAKWREAASRPKVGDDTHHLARLRERLSQGLNLKSAVHCMDEWSRDCGDGDLFARASDALLGVRLTAC